MCKVVGFNLTEIMPYLVGGEFIQSDELFNQYAARKREENPKAETSSAILKLLVKSCVQFKFAQLPTNTRDGKVKKAIYAYFRASYNALSTIIWSTKTEERFYSGLLLAEKKSSAKTEIVWEKLVQPDIVYDFPVILPEKKTWEDRIYGKVEPASETDSNKVFLERTMHEVGGTRYSYVYVILCVLVIVLHKIFTVNPFRNLTKPLPKLFCYRAVLADSSLAMEATDYDFTSAFTVEHTDFYKRIYNQSAFPDSVKDKKALNSLEWSELNAHECMFMFTAVLKKINSIVTDDDIASQNMVCLCLL